MKPLVILIALLCVGCGPRAHYEYVKDRFVCTGHHNNRTWFRCVNHDGLHTTEDYGITASKGDTVTHTYSVYIEGWNY